MLFKLPLSAAHDGGGRKCGTAGCRLLDFAEFMSGYPLLSMAQIAVALSANLGLISFLPGHWAEQLYFPGALLAGPGIHLRLSARSFRARAWRHCWEHWAYGLWRFHD